MLFLGAENTNKHTYTPESEHSGGINHHRKNLLRGEELITLRMS
jgi:hypothetical protein